MFDASADSHPEPPSRSVKATAVPVAATLYPRRSMGSAEGRT